MSNQKCGRVGKLILLAVMEVFYVNFEMNLVVEFNRKVDLDNDYICPGGFEMTIDGKNVEFDFNESQVDSFAGDDRLCCFNLRKPDFTSYPKLKKITAKELKNISAIKECFIYTGEPGETDLKIVSVKEIGIVILGKKTVFTGVSSKVVDEYNALLREREVCDG